MGNALGAQQWTNFISFTDYLLLPIYIIVIYSIFLRIRNNLYPLGHPWRKYFLAGLSVKIIGAIAIGLVYQYYYHGGDTGVYFAQGEFLNRSMDESFVKWLNLLFKIPSWHDGRYYYYTSQLTWYQTNTHFVVAITAVINIIGLHHFLPSSIIFAVISFTGIWAMFRTFAIQYPQLLKPIALVILFIPSVVIWGSGIFKDTLCLFGLGWMLYATFRIFVQGEFKKGAMVMGCLGFYVVAVIKVYILLAFVPALAFWILLTYSSRISSGAVRVLLNLSVGLCMALGFYFSIDSFSSELGTYSLENLATTTAITRDYIYGITGEDGSAYDLGVIQPNFTSILTKFPEAVNVALFRPYIWEAKKAIVLLNALEPLFLLFLTLKCIFLFGPRKIWTAIRKDPNIQFCLIFSIVFSFAVGLTSGNFGTLSRYRIPSLPLYSLSLVLIYYTYKPDEKRFISFD